MLRKADRTSVAKEHGVSEQTLYTWLKRFGIMESNDVKRLRQLELENGRLTVVDEYTRESLAIDVAGSIRSTSVIEVLSQLISVRGVSRILRSDNGPEFVSNALLRWATSNGLDMALIEPGKPRQNGLAESFNGKFRDGCLSMEWFRSRAEAKVVIESWRCHYNRIRPHSSLGNLTPLAFSSMG